MEIINPYSFLIYIFIEEGRTDKITEDTKRGHHRGRDDHAYTDHISRREVMQNFDGLYAAINRLSGLITDRDNVTSVRTTSSGPAPIASEASSQAMYLNFIRCSRKPRLCGHQR